MTRNRTPEAGGDMLGRTIDGMEVVRALAPHPVAERYLAHDLRRRVDRLVYLFRGLDVETRERARAWLRGAAGQRRPHTLTVEAFGRDGPEGLWAMTAYPGNHQSIVTLDSLRVSKGGVFSVHETSRAVEQILDAVAGGHRDGCIHGPLDPGEILINPRGTILVELHALRRALDPVGPSEEAAREEVRSVAGIAWTLLTGHAADEHEVFAPQARRTVDRRWIAWIERGLDPVAGFANAEEAVATLPDHAPATVEVAGGRTARAFLGRISSAVASRRPDAGKNERTPWSRKK